MYNVFFAGLLLLSACFSTAFAQTIFPTAADNPFWEVQVTGLFPDYIQQWTVGEPVFACEEFWTPIYEVAGSQSVLLGYYSQDESRVYYRATLDCAVERGVLIDYSLNVGDSIIIAQRETFFGEPHKVYHVLETGTRSYGGISRKYLLVESQIGEPQGNWWEYHYYRTTWVEGLGDISHPFPTLDCVSLNDNLCETFVRLLCLRTQQDRVLFSTDPTNCSYDLSGLTRIHVDQDRLQTSLTDGSSWEQAFASLQDALAIADYGDSIWVADGTYFPTEGAERHEAFQLVNGVKVFGGFAGTEATLVERDWAAHPTILSGEIGDPLSTADNSYHVVVGQDLDVNTTLDGFIVEGGHANASFSDYYQTLGGGLFLFADEDKPLCVPQIRNCHFRDNEAANLGGAVYCHRHSSLPYQADPSFVNCTFSRNKAIQGSAVHKAGTTMGYPLHFVDCTFSENENLEGGTLFLSNLTDSLIVQNCRFLGNQSLAASSGIELLYGGEQMVVQLTNSEFIDNAGAIGGALFMHARSNDQVTQAELNIAECTFTNNSTSTSTGGAIMLSNTQDTLHLNVQASLFDGNQSNGGAGGAIFIEKNRDCATFIDFRNSEFYNNSGREDGGGVLTVRSLFVLTTPNLFEGTIRSCVFSGNKGLTAVNNPGGSTSHLEVINCTTHDNGFFVFAKAPDTTLATAYLANNFFYEYNNILLYNGVPGNRDIWGYKLQNNVLPGPGSFGADREAADLGGNRQMGGVLYPADYYFMNPDARDFRMAPCSPGVNGGSNEVAAAYGLDTDILGNARIAEDIVDMGAIEGGIEAFVPHFTVTHASSASAFDGQIVLDSITGGTGNYSVEWQRDGSTDWVFTGLRFGSYFVIISNDQGCALRFAVRVDVVTATNEVIAEEVKWNLFPNPVRTNSRLSLETDLPIESLRIYNIVGQQLWAGEPSQLVSLSLNHLIHNGLLLVQAQFADGRISVRKLIVKD